MSWWDFLTLLFGRSPQQPVTDEQPPETAAQSAAAQPSRLDDTVSNVMALTLLIALAAAILLLGNIALELVELPPALSGPQ